MLKVIANIDLHTPLSEIAAVARRAEKLGFDRISIPDVCHDGLVGAAIATGATEHIEIANSALVCFPRSPMTTAVAVWDLQAYSKGRYKLGLGPLVAPNILQKYSTAWYPPAPRMREYVNAMHAIFRCWQYGERLNFVGKYYQFTRQQTYVAPPPIEYPDIPLHLAAVGPKMSALAGELADAVSTHPTNTSPRFIREHMLGDLERGCVRAGRSVKDLKIIVNPLIATGCSAEEIAGNREGHRHMLATILSTPNYWRSLEMFGWDGLGPRLRQMTREGRWGEMACLISDEMLSAFVISAPWEELDEEIYDNFAALADYIGIPIPENPSDDKKIQVFLEKMKLRGI